mgnify:CR=1 FL=1|jgi:hypothetical protein
MIRLSKAMRYRALAARETNKAVIGLLHRLADEVERKQFAKARPFSGPAEIIPFPMQTPAMNPGLIGMPLWPASKRAS